jgi:threonylcarbamoyladenosine tRNA methylthiotransferase MtaB
LKTLANSIKNPVKVALKNIGCKLNAYEVEALSRGFHTKGYQVVPFNSDADVYVVNTCTVTGSGDSDSRKAVRKARRSNPDATVVATGCYAQRCPDELDEAGADLILGNDRKNELVDQVEFLRNGSLPLLPSTDSHLLKEHFLSIDGRVEGGRTRGMLQVQDGCDEHCTYCIIPSVRGKSISRPKNKIIEQARIMVESGYKELALTGIHTGSYGYELDDKLALVSLLEDLETIPNLLRIRLNSIEPAYLSDELIDYASQSNIFCRHFHIPLQSGSDITLKKMGRHYSRHHYANRVERITRSIPDCGIGADVMVGFPGESENDFLETFNLIRDLPITYLHVFPFSKRDGTAAVKIRNHCSDEIKKERSKRLIELGKIKRREFTARHMGSIINPLIEDRETQNNKMHVGVTDNYVKAIIAGPAEAGEIVSIKVEKVREDVVYGTVTK